jgi:hypothetical protein
MQGIVLGSIMLAAALYSSGHSDPKVFLGALSMVASLLQVLRGDNFLGLGFAVVVVLIDKCPSGILWWN